MDKRIKFYLHNTNLLPPKPKSSVRHLKQGIQEFHRKYVLVPADKAANNIAFFTSTAHNGYYTIWSCQNVYDALSHLLDSIYIKFGNKLYRQIVCIPMGTNCAPLVADLFLFYYI